MDEGSLTVLRRYFRQYYFKHSNRISAPRHMESREFGYFPFNGQMIRHLSFSDIGTFRALLVREGPAGVYCSNSQYQDPAAEMQKKGWIKAQLIFDIDADALKLPCKNEHDAWLCKQCGLKEFGLRPEVCPKCKGNRILEMTWACPKCIDGTKKEVFKLLDFLEEDFGISRSKASVYFSGNAGFHIEIGETQLDELDQHGRAEISDYLTAQGVLTTPFESVKLAPNDPGWRGRIAKYVRDLPPGSKPFKSSEFEKRLVELTNDLDSNQAEHLIASAVALGSVKLDAMVTTDIHRVFRMPETLNNKTGLVKRKCTDIVAFDPFVEGVALPEEDELISVRVDMCPQVALNGKTFGPIKSPTSVKVPLFLGVYLISRGAARLEVQRPEGRPAMESSDRAISAC
jgi:DNA primase small subunit